MAGELKSIMSVTFEYSVIIENDSLFIRSDKLPDQRIHNWNNVIELLTMLISKQPKKSFGREYEYGIYWFWMRKE